MTTTIDSRYIPRFFNILLFFSFLIYYQSNEQIIFEINYVIFYIFKLNRYQIKINNKEINFILLTY